MLSDLTIKEFLERVQSDQPVPGGGSVAALAGALSAGLSAMVAGLTLGRSGETEFEERMSRLIERATLLKTKLTADIDGDSDAYGAVMNAYRMAKETDGEKATRAKAIQAALEEAARVPLSVAEAGIDLLTIAETVVTEGNPNAVTDGAVAALMARSSVLAALLNVRINLSSIKDESLVSEVQKKADELEKKATEKEWQILSLAGSVMKKQA
jgi:methenyltetrahydrofolate cyclohydrolase